MDGMDLLRMQLNGTFNNLSARLAEVTDDEWGRRAAPGTSKLGFILWHCARIVDWTINSAISGADEVADREPWRGLFPDRSLYGAGIPDAVADTVPQSVTRADLQAYVADVKASAFDWFDQQTAISLDAHISLNSTQAHKPGYQDPEVWAEIADLDNLPAWAMLIRPAGGHVRGHLGECDALLGVMRAAAGSKPRG